MAKSARSKIMKKLRSAKRAQVQRLYGDARLEELSKRQNDAAYSLYTRSQTTKNAFLHPNDADATFPKLAPPDYVDFRSCAVPEAAYACKGGRVKSKPKFEKTVTTIEEEKEMEEIEAQQKKTETIEKLVHADYNQLEEALTMMSIGKKKQSLIIHKGISKKKRAKRGQKALHF